MASQQQGNKRETRSTSWYLNKQWIVYLAHNVINARQGVIAWGWYFDFMTFKRPFSAKTPHSHEMESKREREKEKKRRRRRKKLGINLKIWFLCLLQALKVRFFISWAPHWYQNKFLACLYKLWYDLWKILDLWVWFHGRTKLLKMNLIIPV